MMKRLVIFICVVVSGVCLAQEQRPSCPSRSGVFAFNDGNWIELQTAQAKKAKLRAAFPAHDRVIAVYPGASSSTRVSDEVVLCGSGVPLGVTFVLARAKDGKDRQVTIGQSSPFASTFTFEIDKKQALELAQAKDSNAIYFLRPPHLGRGQYILFMEQGSSLTSTPVAFDFYIH